MPYVARPPTERFWERVNKNGPIPDYRPDLGPCWDWTAGTTGGRGVLMVDGKNVKAYRFAYELLVGPIPSDKVLDHLCRRPICVNPNHLEPVKNVENILRGVSPHAANKAKTHCKNNHEFTPENTIIKDGYRQCRICTNARALAAYHASGKTTKASRRPKHQGQDS